MVTTQLPGFENVTRDSQKTFRALLEALSRPGSVLALTANLTPPEGLVPACAAACLTLMDVETEVWLQPGLSTDVQEWLRFHAGCRFSASPAEASFAVVHDVATLRLDEFCWGSAEMPEASTTLLIQIDSLQGGEAVVLTGPGILQQQQISPSLPTSFWNAWQRNHHAYPKGIDVFLFEARQVMGLPRTAYAQPIHHAQLAE